MENYQYTSPTINEDSIQLLQEHRRIMDALERGEYPISHCCFILYSDDKPKGYWNVEKLPELLARFREGIINDNSTLCVATGWNETAEISNIPLEIEDGVNLPEGTRQVIRNGTLMNMSDFIYGCCLSQALVEEYLIEISAILLVSVDNAVEDDFKRIFASLTRISQKLAETAPTH